MKTFRFKDFKIYKDAKKFRKMAQAHLKKFPKDERFRLVDQINRSLTSVVLNIAEGSAKKSDKDFSRYLEISIASLNEAVAGFDMAFDDKIISEADNFMIENEAEELARQIGSFIKKLSS